MWSITGVQSSNYRNNANANAPLMANTIENLLIVTQTILEMTLCDLYLPFDSFKYSSTCFAFISARLAPNAHAAVKPPLTTID